MKQNGALKLFTLIFTFIVFGIDAVVTSDNSTNLISSLNATVNNAISTATASNTASAIPSKDIQIQEQVTLYSDKNLSYILQNLAPKFLDLIKKSGIAYILEGDQILTIFAPSDDAIEKLINFIGKESYEAIIQDQDKLKKLVMLHLSANKNLAVDLIGMESVTPLEGRDIAIHVDANNNLKMDGNSAIIRADIVGTNGVMHLIDAVILP